MSLVHRIPSRVFPSSTRFFSIVPPRGVPTAKQKPLLESNLAFIRHNPSSPKPRTKGLAEIRAAYYTVMGPNYLSDGLGTMGHGVDGLKFAGGSHTLFPEDKLREVIELAHSHDVYVSTGGTHNLDDAESRVHRTSFNAPATCGYN